MFKFKKEEIIEEVIEKKNIIDKVKAIEINKKEVIISVAVVAVATATPLACKVIKDYRDKKKKDDEEL